MLHKLKNLSGFPLDVATLSGPMILPAYGEIPAADLDALELAVMQESPYVEVSEARHKTGPLDHDGDGKKGGSVPADQAGAEIEDIRARYAELSGEEPDGRWGEKRLQAEIDKLSGTQNAKG